MDHVHTANAVQLHPGQHTAVCSSYKEKMKELCKRESVLLYLKAHGEEAEGEEGDVYLEFDVFEDKLGGGEVDLWESIVLQFIQFPCNLLQSVLLFHWIHHPHLGRGQMSLLCKFHTFQEYLHLVAHTCSFNQPRSSKCLIMQWSHTLYPCI